MDDLWTNCFEPGMNMPPKTFTHTFCRVCVNVQCSRSAGGKTAWIQRMSTQVDKLFNHPSFADPADPRYQHIRDVDFPSAVREAMRLEISDRRGDWSIPTDEDASRLAIEMVSSPSMFQPPVEKPQTEPILPSQPVTTVVRGSRGESYDVVCTIVDGLETHTCTCKAFQFGNGKSCKHIRQVLDAPEPEVPVPHVPDLIPTPVGTPFFPPLANIPVPKGGVMVDGSAPPALVHQPRTDPWAVPPAKPKTIPVGGKVVLGGPKS